tara:strand:- start:726 stop:923 length:198 start_codon:yes stop_codon:yes gene_type:complete
MKGQMRLFETHTDVDNLLEKYVDNTDLGKTRQMERDLNILTEFINTYGETMIPLLESYLKKRTAA